MVASEVWQPIKQRNEREAWLREAVGEMFNITNPFHGLAKLYPALCNTMAELYTVHGIEVQTPVETVHSSSRQTP